jgi:hypothetical protein
MDVTGVGCCSSLVNDTDLVLRDKSVSFMKACYVYILFLPLWEKRRKHDKICFCWYGSNYSLSILSVNSASSRDSVVVQLCMPWLREVCNIAAPKSEVGGLFHFASLAMQSHR